jgi:hypothetical protein
MMNATDRFKAYLKIPPSLSQGVIRQAKNLVTWEGRDISKTTDDDFLRKGDWENNLKLLANLSRSLKSGATTKELWQWQTKFSYISEGLNSKTEQKNLLASAAYRRWLAIGLATGVGYAFFKAMQLNFQCLGEFDAAVAEAECNIRYGQAMSQPAMLTKAAFGAVAWCAAGLWIHALGDFGLHGYFKERQMKSRLTDIYKDTANSTLIAFWKEVDDRNETKAREIYQEVQAVKNSSAYHKMWTTLNLDYTSEDYDKMLRPFQILIEEVLKQDLKALFSQPKG